MHHLSYENASSQTDISRFNGKKADLVSSQSDVTSSLSCSFSTSLFTACLCSWLLLAAALDDANDALGGVFALGLGSIVTTRF